MRLTRHSRGFTLIEILVSVSIISLLASVILSATNSARKNARDSKRIASIRELQTGLELYFTTNSSYPDSDNQSLYQAHDAPVGNWDTPEDGDFLTELVASKNMQGHVFDPLADQANLRYYKFPAGAFGCPANRGGYYVLGVVDMEVSNGRHQLSPGWSCSGFDFGDPNVGGFEFVVGKYEQ
ncbi:MAG: hypothetical protein AMXMBFR44_6190 [Candidatus Campbellbacteria bacterium]